MTTRRALLLGICAGALATPISALAQQSGKVWRVGYLGLGRITRLRHDGLVQALRDLGYVENKNLVIEWRFAEGDYERLPALAAELVRKNVDVLVTSGTLATRAAQKATATTPIVMTSVNDPVSDGFVASLARPGGNITGVANLAANMGPKHLEMLLSMAPRLTRVAVLLTPVNPSHAVILETIRAAGEGRGVRVAAAEARNRSEIDKAFARMASERVQGFIVAQDAFLIQSAPDIAALAMKHRLPSMAAFSEYPDAGGLLSYGQNLHATFVRSTAFVGKILNGAKPADLPVEQPTTLELVINRKTAKALALTIPQSLLISADRVIE